MRRIASLFLLFSLLQATAQDFWTETFPFTGSPGYYVKSISIVDATKVWVLGANNFNNLARFACSLDGGITWNNGVFPLDPQLVVSNIHAVSATKVYASAYPDVNTQQGGVWLTEDAGATWTKQPTALFNTGNQSKTDLVHFFNTNDGVVIGDSADGYFEIYTTSNAGSQWTRILSTAIPAPLDGEKLHDANFYDARLNAIWFGTNKGRIFKSFDKGQTWTVSQSPVTDFASTSDHGCFAFRNPYDGILIGDTWEAYRSGNGGTTWNDETIYVNGPSRNVGIVYVPQTTNTYYAWGKDSQNNFGSSFSPNGGMNWVNINAFNTNTPTPVTAKFYSSMVGFCTGLYNPAAFPPDLRFFRLTDPNEILLQNDAFTTANTFSATPNPTKDWITISGESIVNITVFDLLGKTVFAQNYAATKEAVVNVEAFQNGVYTANITSENEISTTIKIVKN